MRVGAMEGAGGSEGDEWGAMEGAGGCEGDEWGAMGGAGGAPLRDGWVTFSIGPGVEVSSGGG